MEDDGGFGPSEPQQRGGRPPRIPLKAIEGIDLTSQVSIFYRPCRNAATVPLVRSFSREALMVFSDRARRDLQDGSKVFIINGGDQQAIKDVLEWIMECKSEGKAAMFKTYEEETPRIFTKYALAIEVASYLGIPARDFGEGLTKRLTGLARKKPMSWEEVEYFYDKYEDNGLCEVAAACVFFAWWRGDLDEDKTPDDMCFLSVLREELPLLDKDLHKWAEKNEEEVRAKWAKKDEEKRNGGGGGGFGDESGSAEADGGGVGAGWSQDDNTATTGATGGWDAGGGSDEWGSAAAPSGNNWEKENAAPSGGSSSWNTPAPTPSGGGSNWDDADAGGNDWAEEVNEAAQPAPAW